jgi:magnesium chelatase family protein
LSQPILDRIDIHVELESVEVEDLVMAKPQPTNTHEARALSVRTARDRQMRRYNMLNNEVSDGAIRDSTVITDDARELLGQAIKKLGMSARGYVRVLRVARTIADLAGVDEITEETIAEAISYRSLDRLSNVIHGAQPFRKVG